MKQSFDFILAIPLIDQLTEGNMVGLGRVELPTYGLGKQGTVLMGFENCVRYYIPQPLTRDLS
jgi:hypothetical protein